MAKVRNRRANSPRPQRLFQSSTLRSIIVAVVAAKVALVVVVLDPIGQQAFDLPKTLLSHAFGWLLAALLIVAVLDYGIRIVPASRAHVAVVMFVLVSIAATALAPVPYVAMFGERARYLGLTFVLDMLVLYLAAAVAIRTARDFAAIALSIAAAAVIVLSYAAIQRLDLDPVQWSLDVVQRPASTFGNPDQLGAFLAPLFAGSLAATIFLTSARKARLALLAASLAVAALALIAVSATRAALVGAFVGLLTIALTYVRVRGASRATAVRLAGASLVASLVSLGLLLTPIGPRILATFSGSQVADRVLLYQAALRLAADRPLLGWGPDSFSVGYPAHRTVEAAHLLKPGEPESSAHSWLFQTLATTGLLGVSCLLAVFLTALWTLFSLARNEPLAAATLAVAFAAWAGQGIVAVGTVGADWIPWLAAGAAVGLGARDDSRAFRMRRAPPVLLVTLVLLALIPGLAGTNALGASRSALAASVAIDHRDARARTLAQASVRADPGRAEYWNLVGLAYDIAGAWRDSGNAYGEAASRAPYEGVYWMNLARSRARQALGGDGSSGGAAAARRAAQSAVDADPNDPATHVVLGEIESAFGNYLPALESFARAASIVPLDAQHQRVAADAADRSTDPAVARKWLQLIIASKDSGVIRAAIARAALRQGDAAGARENAVRAAELDPLDPAVRQLIESLHLEQVVSLPDLRACTSTRWIAEPPSPQRAGTHVTFTIAATGCDRQESQLAFLAPDSSTSVYLSLGAWAPAHDWDTSGLAPGTYRVLLYSRRAGWPGAYQAFFEGQYVIAR